MSKVKAPREITYRFRGAPMAGSSFHYDRQISNEYQMTNAKNKCPPIISNATISGEDTQLEKDK
jgi:hypothetical protein